MGARGPISRIRMLPLAIFVLGAMLSVKLGTIWQGLEVAVTAPTFAEEKAPASATPKAEDKSAKADDKSTPTPSTVGASKLTMTEEEITILQKLAARREELDARERELDLRQNVLAAAEKRIDAKLDELKKMQGTVVGLIQKHDEEEETKLKSLVKMYETMKPKEAALIFEKLEMPVLLSVVERMREQKSGPILAKMDTTKAEKLTAALAERRALPKTAP
jgi:flagellar motility protein MotE (MotC chaperone)